MTPARVGLTGGIGSGKTTVCGLFGKLGVPIINADSIARELTLPGTRYHERIVTYFGAGILGPDGSLDRSGIARRAFADSAAREFLESLLHPPIRARMHEHSETVDATYCILEIPLLIETGQWREMDRVVVVTCPLGIRRRRLERDRRLDAEIFQGIVKTQLSDEERIRHADDVISNDREEHYPEHRVRELHGRYLSRFRDSPA